MPISTFPIISLWKLLSCHSNESTWATTIKNIIYVEANVCRVSASSPLQLLRRRFLNIFSKLYLLCCHGNQSNSAIWTKFIWIVEDYSRNISVKKNLNICSETAKIANFHFSHYKSMETIGFHNNQSSYPTGTKYTIIRAPTIYRCYRWNIERIGFTASEEVVWKCWRTTDGWRMPAYTISSPMSLRLRWANNSLLDLFLKYNAAVQLDVKN